MKSALERKKVHWKWSPHIFNYSQTKCNRQTNSSNK